jgi:hypothetical protein
MRRDVALLLATRVRAAMSVRLWAVLTDPVIDVIGPPDLALRKVHHGPGEVGAAGDLVGALSADSAQTDADLMGTDETDLCCSDALR